MASEILGLFTSPQQYQQQQQDVARSRAMEFARLSPFEQANAAIGQGAYGLAGAIGGALGGQDPQLQKITQRQQLLGMIDPANPDSYGQAIQAALQTGDQEAAFLLRNEMMKVKEQAQNQQLNELKTQDYLTQRGQGMQAAGLTNFANELVGQLKNPDGTINEEVKTKLLSFPQGRAAISEQAKVLPDLRRLGVSGTAEVNPFQRFVDDPNAPDWIKNSAKQFANSFNAGIYNEEQADKLVNRLDESLGKLEPKTPSYGAEAERKAKRFFDKPYSALTQEQAATVDKAVEESEQAKAPKIVLPGQPVAPKDWLKFSEYISKDPVMDRTSTIISDAPTAIETIRSSTKNSFSAASLPAAIAKLTGEGKNMSNQDIARYARTGGLTDRLSQDVVGFFTGKKTDVTKDQAEQFAVALYRGALIERKKFIEDQAAQLGYDKSPNYQTNIQQLDKKLSQFSLINPQGGKTPVPTAKSSDDDLINKYLKPKP